MATEFARKALELHNKYRAQHNAPPLEWSSELEKGARDHAKSLLTRNEGEPLAPKKGLNLGQNVFELRKKGSGLEPVDDLAAVERAIETWYADLKDYDPNSPSGSTKGRSFSQLVWSSTKRVGLGLARKETAGSMNIVVIGFYDPPGNYQGEFESNVTVQKTNTCLKSRQNDSRNVNQCDSNLQTNVRTDQRDTKNQNFTSTRQIQVNTSENNLLNQQQQQQHQRRDDNLFNDTKRDTNNDERDLVDHQNSSTTTKTAKRVTTTMQKNLVMDNQNSSLDDDYNSSINNQQQQQIIKKQNRDDHSERRDHSTSSNVENSTFETTRRVITTQQQQQTAFKNVCVEERDLSSEIRDLRFDNTPSNRRDPIPTVDNRRDTTTVDNRRNQIVSNIDDQVSTKLTQQQQHHQQKIVKTSNKDSVIKIVRENSPPPMVTNQRPTPATNPALAPTPAGGVQQQSTTTTTSTKKTTVVMTTGEFGEPAPPPTVQSSTRHHQETTTTKKFVNLENTTSQSFPDMVAPAKPERLRIENNTEKNRTNKETTTTSKTSTTTTTETLRVAVELHNEIRRKHGASNVTIDHKLCEEAQTYAKSIITKTERKESIKVGRNVYQMTGSGSPIDPAEAVKRAVDSWYSKIDEYNWDDPLASGSKAKLFTQLIWKSCTTIGVAVETCTKTKTTAVVVLYSPPGNITSDQRYKENVQRPMY